MKSSARILLILIAVLMVFTSFAAAKTEYPSPTPEFFVNDFAGVLSNEAESTIVRMGKELEEKTGAQIVVVTVDTIGGQDDFLYAEGIFTKWGIGQKGKDNGVLILNVVNDRYLRIMTGYGVEHVITDIETADIREKIMVPYLQEGDYDSAFLAGYIAVVNEIAKDSGVEINTSTENVKGFDNKIFERRADEWNGNNYGSTSAANRVKNILMFLFIVAFLVLDGVLFRFRITSTIIKIAIYSSFFRGMIKRPEISCR